MNLSIHTSSHTYELNLLRLTQLCGTDFRKKRYILKSLRKHFSSSKYLDYENMLIDNIEIDGKIPGREYFEVYSIGNTEDILKMIALGKATLMSQYLKISLQSSRLKKEMEQLELLTDEIFEKLNESFSEQFHNIRLSYSVEKLFDIVQKSEIMTSSMENIKSLSSGELLKNFFSLIEQIQQQAPRKMMIIIENIDHFIELAEFEELICNIQLLCNKYDIWCIFSMSTMGYVYFSEEYIEGINVVNHTIFTLPQLKHMKTFVEQQYPCHIEISDEEIIALLKWSIHKIGDPTVELNQKSDVLLKMVNKSLCVDTQVTSTLNNIEKSYLEAKL